MATALSINSYKTITSGQGLSVSANLAAAISTFQNHQPIQLIANIFSTATNSGNAAGNLLSTLTSTSTGVGAGVTNNNWLIDFYAPNVTPINSGNIYTYAELITPIYDPNPSHWTTDPETGFTNQPIIGYNHDPIESTASFSRTLNIQAHLPFDYGMQGFANVFQTAHGFALSNFDLVSSVHLLKNKSYGQSGIGYTGALDLVTGGISTHGGILGDVVKNWGTMYDITNMNSFTDVYVFGQNLLNHGFGYLGGLDTALVNAGLNLNNLSAVPQPVTTTTVVDSTSSYNSYVGQIDLPNLAVQTTTTTVTGSSADVLKQIYSTITGANLTAIVSATGFVADSTTTITSLVDFLDFEKIVSEDNRAKLAILNIYDFTSLSRYLQSKIGKSYFRTWADIKTYLDKLEVPSLPHLTAVVNSSSPLLSTSTVTAMNNITGNGEGPFTNPILTDYLGAVSGMPYTTVFNKLNADYNIVAPTNLASTLQTLDSAVSTYVTDYSNYLGTFANVDGVGTYTGSPPSIDPVQSAISSVNSTLQSIPVSIKGTECQQVYFQSMSHLASEVTNLHKAGVVFNAGYPQGLRGFAQQLPSTAADKDQQQTYQFFANLVTNDLAGDYVRAAISEHINLELMTGQGLTPSNDPNPSGMIYQAQQQNIPLSTYISQNK
jgi:hypothetical protein